MWKQLYKSGEKATLFQLKILLNNVATLDPVKILHACEEFFELVLHAHVVAAGNHLSQKKTYKKVDILAKDIVKKFVDFDPDSTNSPKDKVFLYTTEVLTLGLLW